MVFIEVKDEISSLLFIRLSFFKRENVEVDKKK